MQRKLLIVYGSEKVKVDENGSKYCTGSFPSNVWKERYKIISKNITFMTREDTNIYNKDIAEKNFNKMDDDINFIKLEDNRESLKTYFSYSLRENEKEKIKKQILANDIIIARIPSDYAYYAIDYAKKFKKIYFVEIVGCPWDSLWNYNFKGKILAPIAYLKMKKYVKNIDNAIYVTNDFLQHRYPTNGNNISCSDVCLENIDEKYLIKRIEKIKKSNLNEKIILGTCAAIDVKYKGQEYVIKAISKLKNINIQNIEYQLVGGGDNTRLLKIADKYNVRENIKIIGSIKHDMVFKWLDTIDIYVQPSSQEGLPRAVIEAMSRGCPCIVSNAGGCPELIDDNFVFRKKNVQSFISCFERIDKKNMLIQCKKNFENAKKYDNSLLINKRKNFYKKILGELD